LIAGAGDEEHVASSAVEKFAEDVCGHAWTVVSENALFGDASSDFDSRLTRDLTKDLIEAGVGCSDR